MVHALNEISRVLSAGGTLIDLRPLLDQWPVGVSGSNGYQKAGHATDLAAPLEDDAAANTAMGAAAAHGLQAEQEETFSFFYYWDTPSEMQEYLADNWEDVIEVEEEVWANLRSLWATSNADARVRIQMKMLIRRYRKQT
jgi:hypothetical protein